MTSSRDSPFALTPTALTPTASAVTRLPSVGFLLSVTIALVTGGSPIALAEASAGGSGESGPGEVSRTDGSAGDVLSRPALWPQSRGVLPLPRGVGSAAGGLRLRMAIAPIGHGGYEVVRCEISEPAGFASDRRLMLRLTPIPWGASPPEQGMTCELPIELRQGEPAVTLSRVVPAYAVGHGYRVDLLEDGRVLNGFRGEFGWAPSANVWVADWLLERELTLQVLAIDADDSAALAAGLSAFFRNAAFRGAWGDGDGSGGASASTSPTRPGYGQMTPGQPNVTGITAGALLSVDLPPADDWRWFQAYDVVMMTAEAAEQLARTAPETLTAIRHWVLTGGTLVWVGVDDPRAGDDLWAAVGVAGSEAVSEPPPAGVSPAGVSPAGISPAPTSGVWSEPLAAGRVFGVARIAGDAGFQPVQWDQLRRLVSGDERQSLTVRRGLEPLYGDDRFRRWLIAGVAEPPVYTFIGLLTLFVILVGPVAYRFTVRGGRGYLMFLIAPLAALLTTGTMFAYGIVSDGFGTVARVRQLTWIDGHSGDAGERIRGTYFAGLRPADGLRFPHRAEVLPSLESSASSSWRGPESERMEMLGTARIDASGTRFSSSTLPARQQRQFVAHLPRSGLGVVRLIADESGGPPRLASTLAFALRDVIACDPAGTYWAAAELAADGETAVRQLDDRAAGQALAELYGRFRLTEEPGGRQASGRGRFGGPPQGFAGWSQNMASRIGASPEAENGVFEHRLMKWLQIDSRLAPSAFVAIADVSDDAVAVGSAELVDSVRYVFGSMP